MEMTSEARHCWVVIDGVFFRGGGVVVWCCCSGRYRSCALYTLPVTLLNYFGPGRPLLDVRPKAPESTQAKNPRTQSSVKRKREANEGRYRHIINPVLCVFLCLFLLNKYILDTILLSSSVACQPPSHPAPPVSHRALRLSLSIRPARTAVPF